MPHISSLALSHFRSHRHLRLDLDSRPVALFGPNGAGKTNVLEAVSLLSPGRGLRRAAADDIARQPDPLGWKIRAEIAGSGAGHEVETNAEPGRPRITRIDGKPAAQTALARILGLVWLVPAQDRLWIEGADGRRRFLDRIALSFRPDHAETVLAYDKAMRERNRLLKDGATNARWYDVLERRMAETAMAITANRQWALGRIAAAQDGAATAFPSAGLALEAAHPTAEADYADALAESRARDMAAGRTLTGPHRADLSATYADKDMPAALCSTGEQKALLVSLVLANARALKEDTGAAPIVLLDEVAAHLDADRRARLFDEICALDAQAWLTGTGPELFTDLGDRARCFAMTETNRESHAREVVIASL